MTVRITGTNLSVVTLQDGQFRFESLPAGEHSVRVTAVAFVSVTKRVTVFEARETELNVVLEGRIVALDALVIRAEAAPGSVRPAEDVLGTLLTVGAKSEVLEVKSMNGNVAEKTPRQIFAKVPGVFVYDMDGSGNQVNISTRGLDAHRSWELNVRQDGVLLNSDMYGYPASHYSPPMEAIERVEVLTEQREQQLLKVVAKLDPANQDVRKEAEAELAKLGRLQEPVLRRILSVTRVDSTRNLAYQQINKLATQP